MDNEVPNSSAPIVPKRRLPILGRHAISLAVVFALAIPASYYVGQKVYEDIQLNKLEEEDEESFREGLAYVYEHAGDDPGLTKEALRPTETLPPNRAAELLATTALSYSKAKKPPISTILSWYKSLIPRLSPQQAVGLYDTLYGVADIDTEKLNTSLLEMIDIPADASGLSTVAMLEQRLLWSQGQVPLNKWLSWLEVLSAAEAELTQHKAARQLGNLPEHVDERQVKQALANLAKSSHDSVRAMVLHVAAGYDAIAKDPTAYEQIIFQLGHDENKIIARRAWMIVGHLNPFSGYAVNWKDADPFVAEAMLWAAVKVNPENLKPAMDALAKQETANQALIALSASPSPIWDELSDREEFAHVFDLALMESETDAISIWRSQLAIGIKLDSPLLSGTSEYFRLFEEPASLAFYLDNKDEYKSKQYDLAIPLAASFRSGTRYPFVKDERGPLVELAATEGWVLLHMARKSPPPFSKPESPFAKLVAAASGIHAFALQELVAEVDISKEYFANLMALALLHDERQTKSRWLRSGLEPLQHTAILATGISGERPQLINGITGDFLLQNPDINTDELSRLPADELANLGLTRVDALAALLEAAESAPPSAGRQNEVKLLKLALWMRGDLGDDFTPKAEAMLFDEDLPTSTVLMCLLHMKRPTALEYLFGDLVNPRPDLHKLFVQERYWHVFRRFVDTSALTLWLWGDPEAQAFQLEAMRQWYAVNRWLIADGWWPEPVE